MWMVTTAAANVVSWQAATLTLAALVVSGVLRLLTEWQRRKTFTALLNGTREGIVVEMNDGPAGDSITATVGSVPPPQPTIGS